MGNANPFRYRGYQYDSESGFYYLNSRYYDPSTGRFINADGQINDGLLGMNLYAYCENDPVNRFDPTGHAWNTNEESYWDAWYMGLMVHFTELFATDKISEHDEVARFYGWDSKDTFIGCIDTNTGKPWVIYHKPEQYHGEPFDWAKEGNIVCGPIDWVQVANTALRVTSVTIEVLSYFELISMPGAGIIIFAVTELVLSKL